MSQAAGLIVSDPSGTIVPVTAPSKGSGLIGREPQLAALGEAFERAQGGEPVTVLIAGEAGIGKTRLVDEFLAVAETATARTVVGQSVEIGDQGPAFAPLVGVMRALLADLGRDRILELAGPAADALGHLLPELGVGVPGQGDGHGRLYEVVTTVLERLAGDETLVVVLEDLQWADAPTRDLLRFLVRATRRGGLLLVLTYRSDELHRGHPLRPFLAELDRLRRVERLEVPRLSVDEVGALVQEILGGEVTPAAASKIHRRSGGIPFFVEELVHAVDERGAGDLPDSLRDLLLVRVEPLAETTQRLLKLMGAGGNRVEHAVLFAAAGLDVDTFEAALREAVSAGVVVVDSEGYAFRHALLREALHDDMLPGEHERFHVRYAEALEGNPGLLPPGTAAVEIAHHWDSAHDVERAFATSFAAAEALDRSYAHGSAAQMLERALELWDRVADPQAVCGLRRDELLHRAALMSRLAGEDERALSLVKAATKLVDAAAEPVRVGALLALKGDLLNKTGRPGAVETLHEALSLIQDGPSVQRAQILDSLATIAMLQTRFDEAVELASEALALADQVDARAVRSSAYNTRGTVWVQQGRFEEGFAELDRAREAADGLPAQLLRYHINASDALNLVGRFTEAAEVATKGRENASEYGRKRTHGSMLAGNAAEPLFLAGDWPRADRLLVRGIELDPPPTHGRHMQILRAWLAVWRGQLDDATEIIEELRDNFRRRVVLPQDIQLMTRVAAELDLARGDADAAWDAVAAVLADAERPGDRPSYELPLTSVAARALAARVRDGSAHPAEIADDVRFIRDLVERQAATWLPSVWPTLIDAELSAVADEDAINAWQRAVDELCAAEGPAHARVYASYRLGEAQLAAGDRPAAKATLRHAAADADELGAGLIRGWIDELAGTVHLALVEAVPRAASPLAGLTARELEVLHLVAAGKSNREIGEALFISAKTASVHVSNILAKLGVAGRGEAAAIAHREGLLESTAAS